jgi:hypothetical protein
VDKKEVMPTSPGRHDDQITYFMRSVNEQIEDSPQQAAENLQSLMEQHRSFCSLTPQQAAGNTLASGFQISSVTSG